LNHFISKANAVTISFLRDRQMLNSRQRQLRSPDFDGFTAARSPLGAAFSNSLAPALLCEALEVHMRNMKVTVIIGSLLVSAVAVAAMRINQLKVHTSCKDERLYMDGGYYATIESGGFKSRTLIRVFQRHNGKRVLLDSLEAIPRGNQYLSPGLQIEISKTKKGTENLANIRGLVKGQKVEARLLCLHKS
jgi:hypothetical protein